MQTMPILLAALLACGWGSQSAAETVHAQIDRLIEVQQSGPAAALTNDLEFLRRVYLDLTGNIPAADEARRFPSNSEPGKREALIDQLLNGPEWPRRMEQALTVMLLERRAGGKIPDEKWRGWLRGEFAKNRPWHELVRDFFEGDPAHSPAAKLIAGEEKFDADVAVQTIGRLFLGMDLKCAQCHDHPSVPGFTQSDYFGLRAYLTPTKLETDKLTQQPRLADGALAEKVEFKSVFKQTGEFTQPHLPGAQPVALEQKTGARATLAVELASPANARFIQNAVNRFWWLLMGRGLVHPLDRLHAGNPASHPELLEMLSREFAAHNLDVKWLLREIALSSAYQRASRAPGGTEPESIPLQSYRVASLKPLSAEQLGQAAMRAAGELDFMEQARDTAFTLKSYISGLEKTPPRDSGNALALFASIFGHPAGEPEVEFAPGMAHTLFLMNDRMMLEWLKPNGHNLAGRLSRLSTAAAVAEELYFSVLTRAPEQVEKEEVADYLEKNEARREAALGELEWALLAGAEFRLNH